MNAYWNTMLSEPNMVAVECRRIMAVRATHKAVLGTTIIRMEKQRIIEQTTGERETKYNIRLCRGNCMKANMKRA